MTPRTAPRVIGRSVYEHPWAVRFTHWVNAVALVVMILSGLQIFAAFPSFGPKSGEHDLFDPTKYITLGGWLAGGLRWHFTFMWIFMGAGILYVVSQIMSGHWRTVVFMPRDIPGVWPMARHYFFFGKKPPLTEQYNPLQKLAYTQTIAMGALSMVTGLIMYKPAQLSGIAWIFGGYHYTRVFHFLAMCGFLAFIPGHLVMVAIHGWSNFAAMVTGWKKDPEYLPQASSRVDPPAAPGTPTSLASEDAERAGGPV